MARRSARRPISDFAPDFGICQWFHFHDHRLDDAARWLKRLGVRYVRTGLTWADSLRPGADAWFDCQMRALEDSGDPDVLLHARAPRREAAPHQPAAGRGGIRGVLLPHAAALLASRQWVCPAWLADGAGMTRRGDRILEILAEGRALQRPE